MTTDGLTTSNTQTRSLGLFVLALQLTLREAFRIERLDA